MTPHEALQIAERYIRFGDGQSQDMSGRVQRGREREPVDTHPSRGEALAAIMEVLGSPSAPETQEEYEKRMRFEHGVYE